MHSVGSSSLECSQNWLLSTKRRVGVVTGMQNMILKKVLDIFDALGKIGRIYTIESGMLRCSVKSS